MLQHIQVHMMETLATLLLKSKYKFYRNTYIDWHDEKQDVCMDSDLQYAFERNLLCSARLHLFDQKYSENSSIVKYIIFIII